MAAKILIATTCRWFSTARMATAFAAAGCAVDVVCPADHPVLSTRAVQTRYPYNGLMPLRSMRAAILAAEPDLVIPCDDLAMKFLHRLYESAACTGAEDANSFCGLLAASLGDPAGYPITESRDNFMAMIYGLGIRAPETKTIASLGEMEQWLSQFGFPAVLKADGTSGGEGVKVVQTLPEALRAYKRLHAPVAGTIAAKRAFVDSDWNCILPWVVQRKRVISIQSFVDGPDANMALACWQGEILSSISVEVLQTWKPKGPASLVRLFENSEMRQAANKIIARLKFSGLCGLDFLLDKISGEAYLIEMNARATQTSTLPLGVGRDLITDLCSMVDGKVATRTPIELDGDTIALFPQAWQGDRSSRVFQTAYHDIPWAEPDLVRRGMEQIKRSPNEKWIQLFSKIGLYKP